MAHGTRNTAVLAEEEAADGRRADATASASASSGRQITLINDDAAADAVRRAGCRHIDIHDRRAFGVGVNNELRDIREALLVSDSHCTHTLTHALTHYLTHDTKTSINAT